MPDKGSVERKITPKANELLIRSISDFKLDLIMLFSQGRYDLGLLNSEENVYSVEQ